MSKNRRQASGQPAARASVTIRRETISVTISIGVTNFPEDTLDRDELLSKADQALYEAKRLGRNRICSAGSQP